MLFINDIAIVDVLIKSGQQILRSDGGDRDVVYDEFVIS